MLEKKEAIQKTFRIDLKTNNNFELLSEILERTQNDLANIAIQDLLEENAIWLSHNIFVDYAFEFFENCNDSEFEIDNVKVRIRYIENDEEISEKQNNIKLTVEIKENGIILDSWEKLYNEFSNNWEQKIKKDLRELYYYINPNCLEIKNYLEQLNNYK